MKVEFLYFDGCPNHEIALANLKAVMDEAGAKSEIELINIQSPEDVRSHRFLGSPSIRINDKDLEITEDNSTTYSMRCRLYKNCDALIGFPSKELIRKNLLINTGEQIC